MSLKRRQLKFTLLKFDIFLRSLIFVRCCVAPLRKKGVEQCSFARVQYRYIYSNLGTRCQKSWVRSWEGRCGEVARGCPGSCDVAAHIVRTARFTRFIVVRIHVDRCEIEVAAGGSRSAGLQNDATGCMFVVERGRRSTRSPASDRWLGERPFVRFGWSPGARL